MGRDLGKNCGGGSAAEGKSEYGNGQRSCAGLKKMKCGNRVLLTLGRIVEAGAAAVSGVVEYKRSDAAFGEDFLRGNPMLDGFSDAVTDEHTAARRKIRGLYQHRIKPIFSTGNCVP